MSAGKPALSLKPLSATADLDEAVTGLLAVLERHAYTRSFAAGAARVALLGARERLEAAFSIHAGEPGDYARRRRVVQIVADWLAERDQLAEPMRWMGFQKTSAALQAVSPAFAGLSYEAAAALVKRSAQGPIGAKAVASRWAYAVKAFSVAGDAFTDQNQDECDARFEEAMKAGRRKSRAK